MEEGDDDSRTAPESRHMALRPELQALSAKEREELANQLYESGHDSQAVGRWVR
jgi:hypothetical protein